MNKMIACCGLNCEKCDAYIATKNNDDALRKKTAQHWSKLNNTEITPEMINCEGCRASGIKTVFCDKLCTIRACAKNKSLPTCKNCPEKLTCKDLSPIISTNKEAQNNLKDN